MHIGLTGFRACIPALLGNTDIVATQIIFRAMPRFVFLVSIFMERAASKAHWGLFTLSIVRTEIDSSRGRPGTEPFTFWAR